MNSLLFGISIAAILSTTSLLIVLLRVSPLLAPVQALSAFFISVFLSISTLATLLFILLWKHVPHLNWDTGTLTSIAFRQGVFLGTATTILIGFHVLGLLNWWIAVLIYGVFLLVETALEH
ncbi:hypothetical protein FJZ28_02115 [Candidatus Peregrinibacteria bacterium]|nr:hypothetical protein [Candidatus Peregrinibacteria bacterium]